MKDTLFDPTVQMFLACTYSEEDYKNDQIQIQKLKTFIEFENKNYRIGQFILPYQI